MSLQRIVIDVDLTADNFKSVYPLAALGLPALQSLEQFFAAVQGGAQDSNGITVLVGAVQAVGTVTFSSTGPTNGQSGTIAGVEFTAVTSGATGNQFNISATPATVAANLAAAINASSDLAGIVTAESVSGVVHITAVVPGLIGNGLVLDAGDLANTVAAGLAGGSDGTEYSL